MQRTKNFQERINSKLNANARKGTNGQAKDTQQPRVQPDIILIITDQQRATQNFPEGWERANLPTMTRLKQNGFSFDRAFINTCMCSPSRATMLTGTFPAHHGVSQTLTSGGAFSPAEVTLDNTLPNIMNTLHGEGYDVQYRGKWHLSKGIASTGTTIGYGALTHADVSVYGGMGWVAPDAGEDTDPLNFGGGYANHDARYVAQAIEYLRQVKAKRAKGNHQPYCLVLSIVNPHDVLAYPKSAEQFGYSAADLKASDPKWEIQLPPTVHEHLYENKKPMAQVELKAILGVGLGFLDTDEKKMNYLNFYANLIIKADQEIGYVIEELYKEQDGINLANQAIVIQTSDHGEMGLSHGGLRQKMFVAYEEVLRVPLIFSNPLLFAEAEHKNSMALASLVDIMPTILDIAGMEEMPKHLVGNSLLPIMEDNTPVQDSIFFAFDDTKAGVNNKPSMVNAANRLRCIRTDEWKYVYYFHAMGKYYNQYELYNLVEDENEVNNLAYEAAYQEKRLELEAQLHKLEIEKLRAAPPEFVLPRLLKQ